MKEKPPSETGKKFYSRPRVTKLTPKQAKEFVLERSRCGEAEAEGFLESLREELRKKNKE
jgi:hypothetical protein